MFRELLYREIFLVPIMCGLIVQIIKMLIHLMTDGKISISKLTQIDGLPNLHSAVFSSLSVTVGIKYGYSSILFSLVAVYSVIIIHDTMRLKGEKGKQTHLLNRIISSVESYRDIADNEELRARRFKPLDVLCGTTLGIVGTYLIL
ncbi:MAG TPA: divergent PAP2 family protein [Candidatus Bathyarchaeia archaeon]|nr:divergent PAP2 family protein [Candidatus Bathyarchaeia archaeon]